MPPSLKTPARLASCGHDAQSPEQHRHAEAERTMATSNQVRVASNTSAGAAARQVGKGRGRGAKKGAERGLLDAYVEVGPGSKQLG